MAHKTKAEKIAAALRTKKTHAAQAPHINAVHESLQQTFGGRSRSDTSVYEPKDLLKTFSATFFILSLMALFYVAQVRGYIQ